MGEVYRAFDTKLNRPVALKVIINKLVGNTLAIKRFRREVKALASINHPNVVRLFDVAQQKEKLFYTMELVNGKTLHALLLDGAMSKRKAVRLVSALADGLHAVHQKGLLHRDIKPANIMVNEDGVPKLMDFGLVKDIDDAQTKLTATGNIVGTLSYLPPEHLRHQDIDEKSDVFQLGVILYEALTGNNPLTVEFLAAVSEGGKEPTIRPPSSVEDGIPQSLDEVVMKAIASQPSDRYETAKSFCHALNDWLAKAADEPTVAKKKKRPRKRATQEQSKLLRQAVIAVAVVVFALFFWQFFPKSQRSGIVRDLNIEKCGGRTLIVRWQSDWRSDNPQFFVREKEKGEYKTLRRLALFVTPTGNESISTLPFAHRILLTGLLPARQYTLALKRPDGSKTVGVNFSTVVQPEFSPSRFLSLTSDGALEVTVKSVLPFSARCEPNPLSIKPDDPPGRHLYEERRIYRFSLRRLAVSPKIKMELTSIDQEKIVWQLPVAKLLKASFLEAYNSFSKEHKEGNFHQILLGEEKTFHALFKRDKRRLWPLLSKRLVEQAQWYRKLRPYLPGLPTLLNSNLCTEDLRATVACSLLPLELISRGAKFSKAQVYGQWEAFLTPRLNLYQINRGPFSDGLLTQSLPFVWSKSRPYSWRLFIDKAHPRGKGSETEIPIYSTTETMTVQVNGTSIKRSRALSLELSLRTAIAGVIPIVELGDRTIAFPPVDEEVRAYNQMLAAKGKEILGGLGLSLAPGGVLDADFYQNSVEGTFTAKPMLRRVSIPPTEISGGLLQARIRLLVGPIDSMGATVIDGLRLVLHD